MHILPLDPACIYELVARLGRQGLRCETGMERSMCIDEYWYVRFCYSGLSVSPCCNALRSERSKTHTDGPSFAT